MITRRQKAGAVALISASLAAPIFGAIWTHSQSQETKPEEAVEAEPLNGVFQCEYYKSEVMRIENVVNYTVTDNQAGWNWMLELKDDTAIFFTQGRDKICYIHHVEEEGQLNG